MNTRPPIESPSEQAALSVAFNHDSSRFAVGLDTGFRSTPAPDKPLFLFLLLSLLSLRHSLTLGQYS